MENDFIQKFNYSIHPSKYTDLKSFLHDSITNAKNNGITSIGFVNDAPNSNIHIPNKDSEIFDIDEYSKLINDEKTLTPDITILSGLEVEYDSLKETYIRDLRNKVDYLVLKQHSIKDKFKKLSGENNPDYPIEYAYVITKGIESGIFDIVTDPSYFMKYLSTMESEENRKEFNRNALIASQVICESASLMGIPLELNTTDDIDDKLFWTIAKDTQGLKVIYNGSLNNLNDKTKNILNSLNDKLIKENYNPVVERQNNKVLQDHNNKNITNVLTYESQLLNNILKASQNIDSSLQNLLNRFTNESKKKIEEELNEITRIQKDNEIFEDDKNEILKTKNKKIKEIQEILQNQQKLVEFIRNSITVASNIGCQTREEYANIATQIAQYNSTTSKEQKQKIEENINMFKNYKSYNQEEVGNSGLEQSTQLRKTINGIKANDYQGYNGFAKPMFITLILAFIFGFAFGMAYILVRIKIGG